MSDTQPADNVRTLMNSELYAHMHAAVGRLLEHQKEGVGGRACPCEEDPWDASTACPYREEVTRLHAEVADRPHAVILDVAGPMTGPTTGVASVVVPNGKVSIDSRTRDVFLSTRDTNGLTRFIRWPWQDAATTGEALVMAAHAARDEPDPDKVQKLVTLISDFGDTNLVALARHLLTSGVQLPNAS
ncbi:hypothetical protein [Nonomuraea sp. JJY05]|uniref:hypothetical protein n=1 Tax=Nonomuraea sp. JJY05 TaxID=3350255 RepID=UPI00373F6E65